MKNRKAVIIFSILIAVLLGISALAVFADDTKTEMTSVRLVREQNSYRIDVKATISKNDIAIVSSTDEGMLYLFQLNPYNKTSKIAELEPIAQQKVTAAPSFSVEYNESSEMLYAKYLIAIKRNGGYEIISNALYVENPEILAQATYDYPEYSSKKGLELSYTSDAQELGASHTVINVAINEYFTASSSDSVPFTYRNQTYYLDTDKLSYLDCRIKSLSAAGVHCYINFLLTSPSNGLSDVMECLYFTSDYTTGAALYGFNAMNEDCAKYLEAFFTFISQRYTRTDRAYGFAGSYILGYQINSNRAYNYCGELTLDTYMNYYCVAFRILHSAVKSSYSNAKTYISVAGNFNNIALDTYATVFNENLDYTAKDTLDKFAAKISYAGNIPYGIAVSLRNSDVYSTDYRADELSEESVDTQYITMDNLEILTDYLKGEDFLYNGETRSVLINSFGITSDGDENSDGEELQAALFALGYYRANSIDTVEAVIWHSQVDNSTGNFGLWTANEDGTPAEKKKIYNVFKYIDTVSGEDFTSPLLSVLGIDSWAAEIPSYTTGGGSKKIIQENGEIILSSPGKNAGTSLFAFSEDNTGGFEPFDNVDFIETRSYADYGSLLFVKGHYRTDTEYSGAGIFFDETMSIKNAKKITVDIIGYSADGSSPLDFMLRLYSSSGKTVFEGYAQSITPGVMNSISFDITEFASLSEDISCIKLWVRPSSSEEGSVTDYGYYLADITVSGKVAISFLRVIMWIAIILLILLVIITVFRILFTVMNNQRKKNNIEAKNPFRDRNGNLVRPEKNYRERR